MLAALTAILFQPKVSLAIIPQPASITMRGGEFLLTSHTRIAVDDNSREVGEMLRDQLLPATAYHLDFAKRPANGDIHLTIDKRLSRLGKEGYRLAVTTTGVDIRAAEPAGLFYGVQTFRQMLPTQIFRRAEVFGIRWAAPCAIIEDQPRFSWRGMHLDVCRHFMPKEFILQFIDLLSLHKLNTFHWHLTDDQGWRIEIKKYPKLTEVGAFRKDSMITVNPPKFTGKPHGGFYTQDDIREVVAYAAKRFVTIVPEIEMPGHSTAAIAAYPRLGNTGRQIEVGTSWGVITDVYNVNDATIAFLQDVLQEVIDLFPSQFIHVGGDEVPKEQWKASSVAQDKMRDLGLKDEHELQSWFIRQMDTWLTAHNRRLIGWDEILEGGLAPGAAVMSWRGTEGGIAAAKAGHDVVMTPGNPTYFDHYQGDKTKEPLAIGGFTPLDKVYAYEPVPAGLTAEEAAHVLGSQGQLWTEYMPNYRQVEYMAFPRACALSEVLWSPKTSRDYDNFLDRLIIHLRRLNALDVNYRPLDPPKAVASHDRSYKSNRS